MTHRVRLFEVCLRDGLQNEAVVVPTATKVAIARRLVDAGCRDIEVTSFVRPRWVPQLADAADVIRQLQDIEGARFWALVPNPIGLDRALDSGVKHLCTFFSASETHNRKNVNRTVKESVAEARKVVERAKSEGLGVRSYVSTAFGCPYEGAVDPAEVEALALAVLEMGADEVALGDTTGMAHPRQVEAMVERLLGAGVPLDRLALHFHDTRGLAVANAWAAYALGVTRFDGSVSGVGGCPYAPGASGNACTQDLVHLFERLDGDQEPPVGFGAVTGLDLDALGEVGLLLEDALGRPLPGRFHQFWKGRREREQRRQPQQALAE